MDGMRLWKGEDVQWSDGDHFTFATGFWADREKGLLARMLDGAGSRSKKNSEGPECGEGAGAVGCGGGKRMER